MEDIRKKSLVEEQGHILVQSMFSLVRTSLQFERMKSYGYERVGTSTGIIYDDRMGDFYCEWDSTFSEYRCVDMKPIRAKDTEVTKFHDLELIEELKRISKITDLQELKEMAEKYERIYLHPDVFKCAMLAAGCSIELTRSVFQGKLKNGMAIIRPPGHHALQEKFNVQKTGFDLGAERILIVDWDANHGQGIQRAFYNNNRVLYFSIHRYNNGRQWPNLRESDLDYIGAESGEGYNVNVPLNSTDNGDWEYLAIFQQLLIPLAYEYRPNLVIIAAGYNAAIGCIEGEQSVSPACFAHLTHSLCAIANGKVVSLLEGGSFIPSLTESVAQTILTLIGDRLPRLPSEYKKPKDEVLKTIHEIKTVLRQKWKCFELQDGLDSQISERVWLGPSEESTEIELQEESEEARSKKMEKKFEDIISNLSSQLNSRNSNVSSYVCFCTLKEELEWLSMQGLNVTVSSSSLLAAGSIFQVIDAVHNNDAIAGISLIDHTRQTGISDLGPVYGKLKHRINRSMSVILNDGMITPKLNSFICENESILRFNILHSRDQDESNPFFDESDENINKHEVTIRLGNYCHPVDSDYLNLMYRILLPVGYEYSPEIVYVYASLGSGSLSAIGFSHLVHTLKHIS
ncbi:unnamed protein product [Lepeophtheirus salmonis]|uniref:(salmon louse) hypothetical protein n=1 Tax=Lepeophtheirus salmonis TaxID=72036 RepID=A0A7R8H6B4_LEPSM|nr:unnamed protein product [Lepeophtheirus salmonis]CAF2893696.1 unnamed protein product [Lepeophtheirus salmonis]